MAKDLIVIHSDGKQMSIESRSKTAWIQSGTQSVENQNEDIVTLSVVSSEPIPFEIGDKIVVYGRPYWLNQVPKVQRSTAFKYIYDLKFEGLQYQFARATYDVNVDTTGSDLQSESLTADLLRFMQIWKINVERVVPGVFELGEIPEGTETKTLTFGDADNCLAVLQTLCSKYEVEFDIRPNEDGSKFLVNIGTNGKTFVKKFRYGRGGGIYNLTRDVVDDSNIVNRLKVYGSMKNLGNKYRANRLLLPGKIKKESFLEDTESIEKFGVWENAKTFDDIYPHRTGHVSGTSASILEFFDEEMDFDLNEKDEAGNTKWLIAGTPAKIHFNTGMLAGYEFEIASYDHESKKFKVVPFEDQNGYKFPSERSAAFQIGVGDEYVITDIVLPDSYIETAEKALEEAAVEYLSENKDPKVKYSLQISEIYLRNLVDTDKVQSEVFWIGDMIPIIDEKINIDRTIRVTGFKRDILSPYKYDLTIADGSYNMTITQRVISSLTEHDKIIRFNDISDPNKARQNWRNVQEVLGMIFDTDGYFDGGKIRPESIETEMLSVGSKSMQFLLQGTTIQPNYGGDCNRVEIVGGSLVHYAIQEDGVKTWNLQNQSYTIDADQTGTAFYIYARCEKSSDAGTIVLDTTARKADEDPSYYYFLIGVLNSADGTGSDAVRSIYLMYGFTTINGKWIRTGCIQSTDGNNWFDLDGNSFRMGDAKSEVSWNKNGNGKIILRGTIVQSESGDENVIGCYRGVYNKDYVYYYGDEVSFTSDGITSTYRMIRSGSVKGQDPTNIVYWTPIASGSKGSDGAAGTDGKDGTNGDTTIFRYKNAATKPETPTNAGVNPTGWTPEPTQPGSGEYTWFIQAIMRGNGGLTRWSDPVKLTGDDGKPGTDGITTEFIYKRTTDATRPATPGTSQTDDYVPEGWTDNPVGVDSSNMYEWVCTRQKTGGSGGTGGTWSAFTTPAIWAKYGEKGQDGDGFEYIYKRTIDNNAPAKPSTSQSEDYVPEGWTDDPTGVDSTYIFEWVCVRKKIAGVWGEFSAPAVWAKYGKNGSNGSNGSNGDTTIFIYRNAATQPSTPTAGSMPSGWSTTPSTPADGQYTWLSQATRSGSTGAIGSWSTPIKLTGDDGNPGSDGSTTEFIYKRTTSATAPSTPATSQADDFVPEGWTDNPSGVDETNKYEWVCTRQKTGGVGGSGGTWSAFTTPVIWSKWGEKGQDGDGYEYIYKRTANASTPAQPGEPTDKTIDDFVPTGWTDDPSGVNDTMMYEWVCVRRKRSGVWESFSSPALWAKYAKDGAPGESVVYADLSNEIEGVTLTGEGKTTQEFTIETDVHLWYGSFDLALSSIEIEGLPTGVTATTDNTTKHIVINIPKDTSIPSMTEVRITPYGTHDDATFYQSVIFTLIGVQGGKDGVVYYIVPSVNSVVKDKNGVCSVASVTCAKYKRVGSNAAATTTDGVLQYSLDGGTFQNYLSAIATSRFTKTLAFQLKVDNVIVDRETIPMVKDGQDGQDGTSPIFADLDNEMEGIALKSDGTTRAAVTCETNASMWFGTTPLTISSIEITPPTGMTAEKTASTGNIKIKIPAGTFVEETNEIAIKVKTTYGGVEYARDLKFTIAGVRAGSNGSNGANGQDGNDGDDAVLYRLIPSVTSIKKDKDGNYSVSSVTCARYVQVGSGAMKTTTDGSLKYVIDGGTETSYSSAIATSRITKTLEFRFYVNNVIVDRETIPLIVDGTNGTNGTNGQDGAPGSFVEYRFAVNGSTSKAPDLSKTSRTPSGWTTTQPAVGTLQYLWLTKALINGNGTLNGSWSDPVRITPYDGQDGVDGSDGADGQDGKNAFSVGCKVTCHNGSSGQTELEAFYINGIKATKTPILYTYNNGSTSIAYNATISFSRGHNAIVVDPSTLQVVSMYRCDDYGNVSLGEYMLSDLSNLDPGMIVVMIGSDACSLTDTMRSILRDMGGLYEGTFNAVRRRHYFIGSPGLSFGQGFEEISEDPTAKTIMVNVIQGEGIVKNGAQGQQGPQGPQGLRGLAGPTGPRGLQGNQGDRGPSAIFRGSYKTNETYYGLSTRVDVVKYNGAYYVARTDAGSFTNILPTNTSYWNTFGASFESVATTLLLAELANVGGWIFKDNLLISQVGMLKGSSVYYCKRTKTSGSWGLWSTPAIFDGSYWNYVNNDTTEYIFKVSIGTPTKPESVQADGNVPQGWRGDPTSVLSEDYSNKDFVPSVSLDALTGEIRLGSSLCIDRNTLKMFDDSGITKLKVYNGSVGAYDDAFLKSSDSVAKTDVNTGVLYIPTADTKWNASIDGGTSLSVRLGYFEKGSTLTIGSIQMKVSVPYMTYNGSQKNITMVCQTPALTLELYCNDKLIGTWNSGSQGGGTHSSGSTFTLNVACGITKTIDALSEGMYRIVLKNKILYYSPGYSGTTQSCRRELTYSYSYQKAGIEKTILGTDGLVSAWTNGYMFMSAAAFAVRFGNYMFKIDTTGIKKSSDGGASWNSI